MKCKHHVFLFLAIFFWLPSCQEELPIDPSIAFQELLEKNVFPHSLPPGLGVHIEAPRYGISWAGVAGVSKTNTDQKVSTNQPYRIASITKIFVATSILLLYEAGQLSLDDPIINYLSAAHIAILKKGDYALDAITIRHCLNHTSGLLHRIALPFRRIINGLPIRFNCTRIRIQILSTRVAIDGSADDASIYLFIGNRGFSVLVSDAA